MVQAVTVWTGGSVSVMAKGTPDSTETIRSSPVTHTPSAEASGGAMEPGSPATPAMAADTVMPVGLEARRTWSVTAHAQKKARPPEMVESRRNEGSVMTVPN